MNERYEVLYNSRHYTFCKMSDTNTSLIINHSVTKVFLNAMNIRIYQFTGQTAIWSYWRWLTKTLCISALFINTRNTSLFVITAVRKCLKELKVPSALKRHDFAYVGTKNSCRLQTAILERMFWRFGSEI